MFGCKNVPNISHRDVLGNIATGKYLLRGNPLKSLRFFCSKVFSDGWMLELVTFAQSILEKWEIGKVIGKVLKAT